MKVRGHHICCILCFLGSGKKTAIDYFGVDNAITYLLKKIVGNPQMEVEVMDNFDDVCLVCPLKTEDGCGRKAKAKAQNEKLRNWDEKILNALLLPPGSSLKVKELYELVREKIPDIGLICTNCTSSKPNGFQTYHQGLKLLFEMERFILLHRKPQV